MGPANALIIEVRLPSGRFHGTRRTDSARRSGGAVETEEWPPSPLRLFQALVAGAYGGRWIADSAQATEAKDSAFAWLESQSAPIVAAPRAHALEPVTYFVPNNDLDAVGGDPGRVGEIRVSKHLRTSHFDAQQSVLYAWPFDGNTEQAEHVAALAHRLHTLGRGIDQAFATATIVAAGELLARLHAHGGEIARPSAAAAGADGVPCPASGSLDSLKARHHALGARFRQVGAGRKSVIEFRQPPRAHGCAVAYGRGPEQLVFELRDADHPAEFLSTPQSETVTLVKSIRDMAFERLCEAMPERRAEIERVIVGRGMPPPSPAERVRFTPLPSIGMRHTSPSIRRMLVEVPAGSALACSEVRWALAGRILGGRTDVDGVMTGGTLVAAVSNDAMAGRYIGPSRTWRTVTPAVLPRHCSREGCSGDQRAAEPERAVGAVVQALRHAAVEANPLAIRVQREPFRARGLHARQYSSDRFEPARLHHVEIRFDRSVAGPLLIGDGRWLGLGLMAPVPEPARSLHVFDIVGPGPGVEHAFKISRALRSAVMSRAQAVIGASRTLPLFFSGHEPDGSPAGGDGHRHLFYLADDADGDGRLDRLAVVAPLSSALRSDGPDSGAQRHRDQLAAAVSGLTRLRVDPTSVLTLRAVDVEMIDPLFGSARHWTNRTPYRPTRQPKQALEQAIADDVRQECARHGLPRPEAVEVLDLYTGRRGRISARLEVRFAARVAGPLLLGDGAHFGRSLFEHDKRSRRLSDGSNLSNGATAP